MREKNSSLTVRIKSNTKEELKKLAKKKGLTMSELVNECLTNIVEREILKNKDMEQLEKRVAETDKKLLKLKEKMRW